MLFTAEQVSGVHPDKIADQISDAVVSDCMKNDLHSRVAVETLIKDNHIVVGGEITSKHEPNIQELVRKILFQREPAITYDFDLVTHISKQSPDIALGTNDEVGGAGDQGSVFGYACSETRKMLPLPFVLATEAIQELEQTHSPLLLADAKAQCTYDYRKHRIDTFLISVQHRNLQPHYA